MDGLQFTALYTLQDGLAGHAELLCGLDHGDEARRRLLDEAAEQVVGDADFPGRPRCGLFGRNETIFDPAQYGARRQVEYFGRFADRHRFAVRCFGRGLSAGDATIVAQALNLPRGEATSRHRATILAVENSGDDAIGMMDGQAADDVDLHRFVALADWNVAGRPLSG